MARARLLWALWLSAAGALACSSTRNPSPGVPVGGERSQISALAGRWEGAYTSDAGRSGTIVFELKPGDTVARGDVLMVPKGARSPEEASKLPGTSPALQTMPQVLSIQFVSASGGTVRGTMDPYRDPDCECEVLTTFVGKLSGGTIEGTFSTARREGGQPLASGHWSILRKS